MIFENLRINELCQSADRLNGDLFALGILGCQSQGYYFHNGFQGISNLVCTAFDDSGNHAETCESTASGLMGKELKDRREKHFVGFFLREVYCQNFQ
jgi:hypothetical protein